MIKTKALLSKARIRCRKKFLYYFKKGFNDSTYLDWERNYKWQAHLAWEEHLNRGEYERLLAEKKYDEIAAIAVRIESRTNLLFSFEKMALRDAVRPREGAKAFAHGLFNYIYGDEPLQDRFEQFTEAIASLPRKQTRVLTWPLQTVFGFIGNPDEHIFLKPRVTKIAAEKYDFDFQYLSRPNWETYRNLLAFAEEVGADLADLQPRDLIDIQSFIWVMGSDEYPD
ncbi:MAG TPA: hypothetical protein VEB42_00480 [Chitinophagaceae bacterium]|nr:hypothetical protein [Chitinophagaceae bacterium]